MVNEVAMRKIEMLERQYKNSWGKEVDYTILPQGMTEETLALTLERIVETNESILVGYNKIKEQFTERR